MRTTLSAVLVIAFALVATTARAAALDPEERPLAGIAAGRVLSPDGRPVPGAFVSAIHVLDPTDPYAAYLLQAGKQGYAEHSESIAPGARDLVWIIVPRPGVTVRGRITGPDGRPVEGVKVGQYGHWTRSSASGSFAVEIPAYQTEILVRKEGYALLRLPRGSGEPLDVHLDAGATVTGRITGLTLEERARASIFVTPLRQDQPFIGQDGLGITNGRGTFRISHFPPGDWQIAVGVDGRVGRGKLTLAPGQTAASIDIAVPATPEVVVCTPPAPQARKPQ